MKRIIQAASLLLLLTFALAGPLRAAAANPSDEDLWPKVVKGENAVFKVYQPQVDAWDGFTLQAHSAISVQKSAGDSHVAYGVASFTAKTIVNKVSRIVDFEDLKINDLSFPSDPAKEKPYLDDLRKTAPLQMKSIALDRLEANLDILEEQKKGEAHRLNNEPPRILFSDKLAVLVLIDGDPVFGPVKGTTLSRVLNTHVLLLKDSANRYYLHVFGGYMQADNMNGPWAPAAKPPQGAETAEKETKGLDLMDAAADTTDNKTPPPSLAKGDIPVVYVSTVPAELIVTEGEPNFVPLEGTKLLYVSNTSANVFEEMRGQKLYVLASGRWFRAPSKDGPWEYVPADKLPDDFANISDNSTKENVKASIPGTPQAQEALIANNIPDTSKIDRSSAKIDIKIDGEPVIKPIEGTSLSYVFNCSLPLIRVDEDSWFAVYNGVWFNAKSVDGPWTVADSVPPVIYSIPTDSPLHYVTYVRIYDANDRYVYEGYTPGYYGTVVSRDGTVVYGTGYAYPSYIGNDYWYPPMYTYGFGSDLCWTPWYGWSFGFGFGWGFGPAWFDLDFPFFFHDRFFNRFGERHRRFGNFGHFGRAYNSRNGMIITGHGQPHAIRNVFHGGSSRMGTALGGSRHVYGTRSGHVYSYTPRGNTGSWGSLGRQPRQVPSVGREAPNSLNREMRGRETGETRFRSFRENRGMGSWGGHESGPAQSPGTTAPEAPRGGAGSSGSSGGSGGGGGHMGGWGGRR